MFMNSHLGHPAWFWSYVGTLNCQESWLFVDKFRYQLKQLKILKSKCNELKCRFRKLYSNHSNFNDHYPSIPSLTLTSRMAPLEYEIRTSMYIWHSEILWYNYTSDDTLQMYDYRKTKTSAGRSTWFDKSSCVVEYATSTSSWLEL